MNAVYSKPNNRLAWRSGQTGLSRPDAVVRANVNVEGLRDQTLAYVDMNIEVLRETISSLGEHSEPMAEQIYDASNAIFSTAATFGMESLGRAAHSLCDLMIQFEQGAPWNRDAIELHIQSIFVLRKMTVLDGRAANEILNNLFKLVNFVSGQ